MDVLSKITGSLTKEQRGRWDELETQMSELDGDIGRHERQAEREKKAAEARSASSGGTSTEHTPGGAQPSGWSVGAEPMAYDQGNGHSYFLDMARDALKRGDGDGGVNAARERLGRHADELRVARPDGR
jgi:hypothetical protein